MTSIDRRTAIRWVLAAGAAAQLPDVAFAAEQLPATAAVGYGKDPNLLKSYAAGELWPLTLTDAQKRTTRVLCDLIIPADETSPAASAVADARVHRRMDQRALSGLPTRSETIAAWTRVARCGVAAPISANEFAALQC